LPAVLVLTWLRVPAHPPVWLGKARIVAVVATAYVLIAPFVLTVALRKASEQLRSSGTDPEGLVALTAIGGSTVPMMCGLLLAVVGDKWALLHLGFLVTIGAMGYWAWRERRLLFSPTPFAARTKDPS